VTGPSADRRSRHRRRVCWALLASLVGGLPAYRSATSDGALAPAASARGRRRRVSLRALILVSGEPGTGGRDAVPVDPLPLNDAVVRVVHDQLTRVGVSYRQIRHPPGVIQRLARDPFEAAGEDHLPATARRALYTDRDQPRGLVPEASSIVRPHRRSPPSRILRPRPRAPGRCDGRVGLLGTCASIGGWGLARHSSALSVGQLRQVGN